MKYAYIQYTDINFNMYIHTCIYIWSIDIDSKIKSIFNSEINWRFVNLKQDIFDLISKCMLQFDSK